MIWLILEFGLYYLGLMSLGCNTWSTFRRWNLPILDGETLFGRPRLHLKAEIPHTVVCKICFIRLN